MGVYIPNINKPCCCAECWFASDRTEVSIERGTYKKISRCLLAPEEIEDPWRDIIWQLDNKEKWCPLKELKEDSENEEWFK